MTIKGGTTQACAACKYQRRRCSSECPLAPYFPAHQPKTFQNAHRLFGVRNITTILKQLNDKAQRADAMKSIIYEANIRERFPVYGCWGILCQLHYQLRQAVGELQYVHAQLAFFREQQISHNQIVPPPPPSDLQLGLNPSTNGNDSLPVFLPQPGSDTPTPFVVSHDNDGALDETCDKTTKPLWVLQPYLDEMKCNHDSVDSGLQPPPQEPQVSQYYDEMPFSDDVQSYNEHKQVCYSSSE